METSESSNPTTDQGGSGTGIDSISSVLQFVTEFSANAQLFGLAAMWIQEASQTLAEIQLIAVQHDIMILSLSEDQKITKTKIEGNILAVEAMHTRLNRLINKLERLAIHNK